MDQFLPFQRFAMDPLTAEQDVALVHDTPLPPKKLGGVLAVDQVLPFQRCIATPTAMQKVVLVQDTPDSVPFAPGMIDHVLPFHRSINASDEDDKLSWEEPTAKQLAGLVHDTPFNWLIVLPVELGLGTTDQATPFHRSVNVLSTVCSGPTPVAPTAKQKVVVTHDRPLNPLTEFATAAEDPVIAGETLPAGDAHATTGPVTPTLAAITNAVQLVKRKEPGRRSRAALRTNPPPTTRRTRA